MSPLGALAPQAQAQNKIATKLFENGVKLFREKKYPAAIVVFRRVFELDPNPFVLFNIGRCYEEQGSLEEAVQYYDRALKLKGLPEPAKIEALRRIETLAPVMAQRKTFREARREGSVRVDRALYVGRSAASMEAERLAKAVAVVRPDPGPKDPPDTRPVEPPPVESGPTALTWSGAAVLGLGVIAAATGGVFYVQLSDDLDAHDALVAQQATQRDAALGASDPQQARAALDSAREADALADDIETKQRVATAFLGAGALMCVSGALMIALDRPSETDAPEPSAGGVSLGAGIDHVWLKATW